MTFNEFQVACRGTEARRRQTSRERALTEFALGLCGDGVKLADLIEAADPRYATFSHDLIKAAGELAELVRRNVTVQGELDKPAARAAVGRMLAGLALVADVIKTPLAEIAAEAVKQR